MKSSVCLFNQKLDICLKQKDNCPPLWRLNHLLICFSLINFDNTKCNSVGIFLNRAQLIIRLPSILFTRRRFNRPDPRRVFFNCSISTKKSRTRGHRDAFSCPQLLVSVTFVHVALSLEIRFKVMGYQIIIVARAQGIQYRIDHFMWWNNFLS